MKIISSEFMASVYNKSQYPKRRLKEISIVGRSNVGKSSLINYLLNKKTAKTSSTPGKTRSLNYYLINENFYLVDLPGYGYAKVSKTEKEEWQKFLTFYIANNEYMKVIFLLIDIRHELKENDAQMIEYIKHNHIPCLIVLTKADKLNTAELRRQTEYYSNIELEIPKVITSAEKGTGKNELLKYIEEFLKDN